MLSLFLEILFGICIIWFLYEVFKSKSCGRCQEVFRLGNSSSYLRLLKGTSADNPEFEKIEHLCSDCWSILKINRCAICSKKFNIECSQTDKIIKNFELHEIKTPKVTKKEFICSPCYERNLRDKCVGCGGIIFNISSRMKDYKNINKEMLHYNNSYFYQSPDCVCVNCFNETVNEIKRIKSIIEEDWAGITKEEYLRGFEIERTVGRVEYEGIGCKDPSKVKEKLKIHAANMGANGCVEFFQERHTLSTPETYEAGRSENNNPYYRTHYNKKVWYTGYATAVLVKSKKSPKIGK